MAKILIVDDDKVNVKITVEILELSSEDMELIPVSSKEDALVQMDAVDLVISDFRLPKVSDGLEIVRAAQDKGCKIIVMSSTQRPSELPTGVEFVWKRYLFEELLGVVKRVLTS